MPDIQYKWSRELNQEVPLKTIESSLNNLNKLPVSAYITTDPKCFNCN